MALLLASLAVPTLAKLANVTVTATAVPGSVTPGANVAVDLDFYNFPSTSNISQLYLNAKTPSGWTLVGIESYSQGTCTGPAGGDVFCNIGAVNAGTHFTARVVYTTPSGGSGSVAFDWFLFNTTGVANDKGKNSHGDNYIPTGSVTLDTSKDFGGAYVSTGAQVITDSQVLHINRNPQYTSVTSPAGHIGVTVGELAGNTAVCPAEAGTCFGQWSVISVNDGAPYPNGFSVVLGYKGNIGNASFVHLFDSYDPITNPTAYELIEYVSTDPDDPTDICSSATPTASEIPCMIPESSGGNSIITLWLNQNGRLSGY
jgi:hypothetical protein